MSTLLLNTLTGKTSAGSINVTGEGGSTPTNLQQGLVKVWAHVDGTTTDASIVDSFNVGSITDSDVGRYLLNFTNSFSNTNNYATAVQSIDANGYEWAVRQSASQVRFANYEGGTGYVDVVMEGNICGDLA